MSSPHLYIITMPNGEEWAVPLDIIISHKANYQLKQEPHYRYSSHIDITQREFKHDHATAEDWAKNSMDWSDVAQYATLHKRPDDTMDYQDGWLNGEARVEYERN